MSATIDERIVEMKFDDDEFEKGVKSTLEYLEKLKKELNLESVAKSANDSFKNINKAAEQINLESLGKAVDNINYRFSTLGVVATTALQNITNSVLNLAKGTIGNTLTTVFTKGWSRATNIDQASFTLEGLGLDVAQALEDADYAVTDTAFGLDEAAKAASQFAASGIQLGDDMKRALLGVSGMAALTNSSFTSMADIFSHVAGQGRLMTMQLNQIAARGVNAAAALAEYYGVSEAEIREAVTRGEITFEMFYNAMADMYGEHAKEANKTYEGAYANLQAALGRISQPWMTAFRHNMIDVFNAATPVIKAFKNVSDKWITPHVESTIKNISKWLVNLLGNIKVFPEIIRNLRTIIFKPFKFVLNTLKQIGQMAGKVFDFPGLKEVAGFLENVGLKLRSVRLTVKDIFSGDVHFKWSDEIVDVFGGIFSIINMAITGVKAFFKVTAPLWKLIGQGLLKILEGAGALGRFLQSLNEIVSAAYKGANVLNLIASFDIIDFFKNLGGYTKSFFDEINSGETKFTKFKDAMAGVKENGLTATFTSLREEIGLTGIVSSVFLTVLEKIANFAGSIKSIISDLKDGLSFKDALGGTEWGSKLIDNVQKFKDTFKGIDFLSAPMDVIKTKFGELTGKIGTGGTIFAGIAIGLQKTVNIFKKISNVFKDLFSGIKDSKAFKTISDGIKSLWDSIKGFNYEGSGLQLFFKFLGTIVKVGFGAVVIAIQTIAKGIKTVATFVGGAIAAVAGAIKNSNILESFTKFGDKATETGEKIQLLPTILDNAKEALAGGTEGVSNFFKTTFSGWTARDWFKTIESGILSALNASLIGFVGQLKKTFGNISGLIKQISGVLKSFKTIGKDLGSTLKGFAGVKDNKTKFEHIANGIKTIAQGILIIVAAVAILAIIPQDKLQQGLKAMVGIALAIGLLMSGMGAVSKWMTGDAKQIVALTKAVTAICTSLLLVGIAIALMGRNDPLATMAGALALVTVMESIMLIFKQFNMLMKSFTTSKGNTSKASQTQFLLQLQSMVGLFKEMSKAILVMGVALAIASSHSAGDTAAAGGMILSFMWSTMAIFAAIKQMVTGGKNGKAMTAAQFSKTIAAFEAFAVGAKQLAKAFLPMSAALMIISASAKAFGAGTVWASFGMLELFLVSIMGIARWVSKSKGDFSNFDKLGVGMIAVSAAMIIMSGAIAIIGNMKPETALMGMGVIMLLMLTIGEMAQLAKDNDNLLQLSVTMLSMGGAMLMLAGAMSIISKLNPTSIIAGVSVLMLLTVALSILIGVTGAIKSNQLLELSLVMISFAGSILVIAAAMAVLDGLQNSLRSILQIGIIIAVLVGSIVILSKVAGSVETMMIGATLLMLSGALITFAAAMAVIADLDTGSSWRAWGQIALALAAITAVALVLTYSGAMLGLEALGDSIEKMGKGLGIAALGIGIFVAAFSALMVVFGGSADVAAAEFVAFLEVLAAGLGTIGVTLATSITLIIKNVMTNLFTLIPDVTEGFMLMITAVLDALIEYGPEIATKALDAITGIIFAIAEALKGDASIFDAFGDLGAALLSVLTKSFAGWMRDLQDKGIPLVSNIAGEMADQLEQAAADADKLGEEGTRQANIWKENHESKTKNSTEASALSGDATSLLSGDGLMSILTSADVSDWLTDAFGDAKIGDIGSKNITEQITKLFPEDTDFSALGEGGLDSYIEGIQKDNPDLDMSGLADKLSADLDISDTAEKTGSKIGKKFSKKLKKDLTGSEEDTSDLMKKLTNHFGEGSDEIQRLINSGGWTMLQELGEKVADGTITAEDAIAQLAQIMNTATDEELSAAEAANEEFYDKYYERTKRATEGLAAGFMDSGAIAELETNSYKVARDAASGVSDTLGEGNWNSPTTSTKAIALGKNFAQGFSDGLADSLILAEIQARSKKLGAIPLETTAKEGGVASPSKKMKRIALYYGDGFNIGLRQSMKKIRKTAKNLASTVITSLENAGIKNNAKRLSEPLDKFERHMAKKIANISKHLKKANTDKQIKKWTKAFSDATKAINKYKASALGLSGKYKSAKMFLWENSDDYADLTDSLKEYRKERTKAQKGAKKLAKKNKLIDKDDIKNVKAMKKRVKELDKQADKYNKKDGKENKKKAKEYSKASKQLSKYIDKIKDAKKNIKETKKEIKEGYKKYWKQYWKDFKDNANESFRSLMNGEIRKTFELFGSGLVASVDVLGASAKNTLDIFSGGASETNTQIQILRNSIEQVTDVLNEAYDTGIDLFNEFQTTWYNPTEFLEDMNDNIEGYKNWLQGLENLSAKSNTKDLVDYIKSLGFSADSLSQLNMFNDMSSNQLAEAVEYLAQQHNYEIQQYLDNMNDTLVAYDDWQKDLDTLSSRSGITDKMLRELKDMGPEGAKYVRMFVDMTDEQLSKAQGYYAKQGEYAVEAYFDNIAQQADDYSKWKSNISTLTSKYSNLLGEEFIKNVKNMGVDGNDYVEALLSMDTSKLKSLGSKFKSAMQEEASSYLDTMQDNLDSYQDYYDNMAKLRNSGLSDALVDYISDMGYEGAETAQKFVDMISNPAMVKKANDLYSNQVAINAQEYYSAMKQSEADYANWVKGLNKLEKSGLNRQFIKELMAAGVDSMDQVESLLELIQQGELKNINALYSEQNKLNANSLLNSTRLNIADWQEYYEDISKILKLTDSKGNKLDSSIISKLKEMGIDGLDYMREILAMSDKELKQLNDMSNAEKVLSKTNLLMDLKEEKKKMKEWGENLQAMAAAGFSPELIQELIDQGYEATYDISQVYKMMSEDEIDEINGYYDAAEKSVEKAKKALKKATEDGAVNVASTFTSQAALAADAAEFLNAWGDDIIRNNDMVTKAAQYIGDDYVKKCLDEMLAKNEEESIELQPNVGVELSETTTQQVNDAGTTVADEITDAYTKELKSLVDKIQKAIYNTFKPTTGAGSTQRKVRDKFARMAELCVTSFKNTLKSDTSLNEVRKAAVKVANAALKAAKKELGINSPSREFRYIAEYAVAGFANGMDDNAHIAGDAAGRMANVALDSASGIISDMEDLTNIDFTLEPIFDPDAALTGLSAIDEMIKAKQLAVQSVCFDNLSDINTLTTLNNSLNELNNTLAGMESYGERLDNIQAVLDTYLPDATTDIYLDGNKVSSYVENNIANNIVRRRAGW